MILIASQSVFDLNGPLFLAVYIAGFFITMIWSLIRRSSTRRKLSHAGASEAVLTDLYELAYLAGGAPRCAEVAVVKLLTSGTAVFDETRYTKEGRLIGNGPAPSDFNSIERKLHSAITSHGSGGMPMLKISESVAAQLLRN